MGVLVALLRIWPILSEHAVDLLVNLSLFAGNGLSLVVDLRVLTLLGPSASTTTLAFPALPVISSPDHSLLGGLSVQLSFACFDLDELLVMHHEVLERHRPLVGALHIDRLSFGSPDPLSKLHVVADCCTQHDYADVIWQLHDDLLPNRASVLVVYVVDFVEDDPLHILQVV